MLLIRSTSATALVVCLLLAGCAGDGGPSEGTSSTTPSEAAVGDVGTIEGLVVDNEQRPVPQAKITAVNPALKVVRTQTTGEDGRFSFPGLPVGTYRVAAEGVFFKRAEQEVVVVADEAAKVTFSVVDVVNPSSLFIDLHQKKGFINCSTHSLGGYGPINFCEKFTTDQAKFELPLRADLPNRGVVLELIWTPATPATGSDLELAMCNEKDDIQDPLNCRSSVGSGYRVDTRGKSPLVLRAQNLPLKDYPKMEVSVGDGGQTAARVPLTFQQPFELWMSLCYGENCPATYQARP